MLTNPFLRTLERFYGFFVTIGSNLQSLLLLYMRLTWGHQLFLNGIGALEACLGLCLFVGFASRIAAIPVIIGMLMALGVIHPELLDNLKFVTDPHSLVAQRPYPFLITALMVFVFGPGRISIDAWIKRWISKQPRN